MSFNILCLSGGGYLGLYTARVLAALEQEAGKPLGSFFDLLAGTSVGGMIALALAKEVPASTIADEIENSGGRVFSTRPRPQGAFQRWLELRRSALRSKYDNSEIRNVAAKILGADTRIGDLKHPVMIPAVNLTKGRPQIFKTPHHPNFVRDKYLRVVDVALATSAAPTFFPISIVGDELFADGGLYANAPDLLALHEAEHYFRASSDSVKMISIGTTTSQFSFSHRSNLRFGFLRWLNDQSLFNVMLGAQQINTIAMLQHRLGNRYYRIDSFRGGDQDNVLAIDVASREATRTLRGLAESSVRTSLVAPLVVELLELRKGPQQHART